MTDKVDLTGITRDAEETAAESADPVSDDLAAKLDEVDLLIADLGQMTALTQALSEHTASSKKDIDWGRLARLWVLIILGIVVIGLACAFYRILTSSDFTALRAAPAAFSTVTVACIGGIVLIAITVTKSVFMSFDDRNKGVPIPEHFKAVIEPIKDFFGKA